MSTTTKRKVIEARKAIRKKLHLLRMGNLERDQLLRETFQPVTESIGKLSNEKKNSDDAITEFIHRLGDVKIDKIYGVRGQNPYMLGDHTIRLTDHTIHVGDRQFERTQGLLNLIFLKGSKSLQYTPQDLQTYGEILRFTGVHKRPDGTAKSSNSVKYRDIIKPILDGELNTGEGVIDIGYKMVDNHPLQYIYYDDPNEIIERLQLLTASAAAGNTSHTNEIISIISELRERHIIE